jgi:hypothetical protein
MRNQTNRRWNSRCVEFAAPRMAHPVGLLMALLFPLTVLAQGSIQKNKSHYAGTLDFFLRGSSGGNRVGLPPSAENPFRPEVWFDERNGIAARGLVGGATLLIDWWSLLGEPVSYDRFVWQTSGWYEVRYPDKKTGATVTKTITRAALQKYPDLLKRFDAIAPTYMDFEVDFSLGSLNDKDYSAFRRQYNMLETIGSAAPHLKSTFTRKIGNVSLLFARSGRVPYQAAESPTGGWTEYLGLPRNYDAGQLKMITHYWKIAKDLQIHSFRVTKMQWPLGELRAIAERFDQYESGEGEETLSDKLKDIEQQASRVTEYTKNDYWSEATSLNRYYFYIIDANSVQDDYYDLIVNGVNVGPVNNRTGGKTTYYCVLKRGENKVRLALTKLMGKNSRFTVEIDGVFGPREFTGSHDHEFTVNVK